MKKYLRILTASLLILSMAATAVSANSGGGGSSTNRDADASTYVLPGEKGNNHANPYTPEKGKDPTYILAVGTGRIQQTEVESIILKYYDTNGVLQIQVLSPARYTAGAVNEAEAMKDGSFYSWDKNVRSGLGHTGSKMITYYSVYGDQTPEKLDFNDSMIRQFVKEPGVSTVTGKVGEAPFAAGSTEYIRFTTDYPMGELKELSFYFKGKGVAEWSLQGWKIYADYNESFQVTSYAYISNQLGLLVDDKVIYESDFNADGVRLLNGVGNATYVNSKYINSSEYRNSVTGDPYFERSFKQTNYQSKGLSDRTILNFSINISDEYLAGIECLNLNAGTEIFEYFNNPDGTPAKEMVMATVEYTTTEGWIQSVQVPVLANAIMEYILPADSALVNDDWISWGASMISKNQCLSMFQQGDNICFSMEFPNFKELNTVTLEYNNPVDGKDYLMIDSISVYNNWGDKTGIKRERYIDASNGVAIDQRIEDSTMVYRSSGMSSAVVLDGMNSSYSFEMKNASANIIPGKHLQNAYLVSITTSRVAGSGTSSEIFVSFNYQNTNGTDITTQEYSLKDSSLDFYGYNPGYGTTHTPVLIEKGVDAGKQLYDENNNPVFITEYGLADGNYAYAMSPGNTIQFVVSIGDLNRITGVNFRMEDYDDEWQMGSITMEGIDALGRRDIFEVKDEFNNVNINRIYTRNVEQNTSRGVLFTNDSEFLLQKGETRTIDVDSSHVSGDTKERDYRDYYYYMDYEIAASDLGFDEVSKNYEVIVNVAKNSKSALANDNCGSNNLFYFQLEFKNGKSAFVLANQQLTADGFRSGEQERFFISTNEDFGDLVSVHIVPDDVTSEASAMDKLCIDSLEVIKHNANSVNKRYILESPGWIKAEYRDTSEALEKSGRSEPEIATVCNVVASSYVLEMEIAIGYGAYPKVTKEVVNQYGDIEYIDVDGEQFVGDMTAEVIYINSAGERKTMPVQVVKSIYEYMNKNPQIDEDGYISDPNTMFRAHTIDRFVISMDDAISLVGINLYGKSVKDCTLPVASIGVSVLKSEGILRLTDSGYQKVYTADPTLLTEGSSSLPNNYAFHGGVQEGYYIRFANNKIPEFSSETTLETIVSRVPDSINDTVNIFIYMTDDATLPSAGGYTMKTRLYYASTTAQNTFYTEVTRYNESKDGKTPVLTVLGVSASNMSVMTNLTVKADTGTIGAYVDHAIIQQVRSGVVIDTYRVNFTNQNAGLSIGASMSGKQTSKNLGYSQRVTLALGSGTEPSKLTSESYDIAVAIRYKSTMDGGKKEYVSPYVYLTDSGVYSIHEGTVANFDFSEAYVSEIVGIRVVAVNGLKANIESANIQTFEEKAEGLMNTGWYSISPKSGEKVVAKLKTAAVDLNVNAKGKENSDVLKRVDLAFTTMKSAKTADSNGAAAIAMQLFYTDTDGAARSKTIEDIRKYIISGDFSAGSTATLSVMLPGIKNISYITLEPYDKDDKHQASWNLASVGFRIEGSDSDEYQTITVDQTVREMQNTDESPAMINLSGIVVRLTVSDGTKSQTRDNSTIDISAAYPANIRISPNIIGTLPIYGYEVQIDKVGTDGKTTAEDLFAGKEPFFNYEVKENPTDKPVVYRITVSSEESPSIKSVVNITVAPTVAP